MANYRTISTGFWTDSKVDDDFTPEDKYFYMYLLTNPHTNICGCYEISMKQMVRETGYNEDSVLRLIKRLETVHRVIRYDAATKEILIPKWGKYNWTKSEKLVKSVLSVAKHIKSAEFRQIVFHLINGEDESRMQLQYGTDTVSIPYIYHTDTSISESDSSSVTVTNTVTENIDRGYGGKKDEQLSFIPKQEESKKPEKKQYGEFGWVRLSDNEYAKLLERLGESELKRCIQYIDELAQSTGNKNKWKDWNLVLQRCSREGWGKYIGGAVNGRNYGSAVGIGDSTPDDQKISGGVRL